MWTVENRGLYARTGLRYPSDLTDAEWDLVRPFLLHPARSGPAPERLREIVNAVLYVLSTGCQWRALPKGLPPRSTVHGWFGSISGVLNLPASKKARTRTTPPLFILA